MDIKLIDCGYYYYESFLNLKNRGKEKWGD